MTKNKSLIFKKVPKGFPVPGEHLTVEERDIDLDKPLQGGELLLKGLYHSLDPYFRGRMRDASVKSYSPAFPLDGPLSGHAVGEVLKSNNPDFPAGEIVYGFLEFSQYSFVSEGAAKGLRLIKGAKGDKIPLSYYVGSLGMPGQTAYFGLEKIGEPKKGESIFVSAASGAVGAMVGQLAKAQGLRVIGSAGSDEKVKYLLEEAGFDAAFNYKKEKTDEQLKKFAPEGIDIYFENVGGETLEVVLSNMKNHGRIIGCGMISQYNNQGEAYGVKTLMNIVAKRIKFQGFIVGDFASEFEKFYEEVTPLVRDGKIKVKEDVEEGIEKAPEAFLGLLQGKNFGKLVIKL
eukprot:TRINITY_DN4735_c0_g1_i2.p1 TRINITY_DN4735_c0_g1~~TRINITY_DN4735_c0_g1_i2.p1  ORF type:complete len:345 (+),score=130.05 TRINITY_DN4735_c0_g1_i2:164-1198(+)